MATDARIVLWDKLSDEIADLPLSLQKVLRTGLDK
jgi:hypothetical protein